MVSLLARSISGEFLVHHIRALSNKHTEVLVAQLERLRGLLV